MFLFSLICPYCQTDSLRHSRIHIFDWPLLLLGFAPYRCVGCSYRFQVFRPTARKGHTHD